MRKLLLVVSCLWYTVGFGQSFGIDLSKEQELYKATKQVNQFFRRFNAEETPKGDRLYEGDAGYHNPDHRKRYLDMLITNTVNKDIRTEFISEVARRTQFYLDFHTKGWFAEVKTTFTFRGKTETFTLFLSIQEEEVGSKWVITNVYNASLYRLFDEDTAVWNKFIHPMSHELDFMNLNKVFREGNLTPYLKRDFQPDYLTILAYEHKLGNLKFETVSDVKFHFLQVTDWYFEVNNIPRDGNRSGWMITKLLKVPEADKEAYSKMIFRDKDM